MQNPENSFSDHAIMTSAIRWDKVWVLDIYLPINWLRFSAIGDYFVATGEGVLNIWKKDSNSKSFNSELLFCADSIKHLAIPSRTTQFYGSGLDIIQCELSSDGSMIYTLEKDSSRLKIWASSFQIINDEPTKKKDKKGKKDKDEYRNLNRERVGLDSSSDSEEEVVGYNYYGSASPPKKKKKKPKRREDKPLELELYELIDHRSIITEFKVKKIDLYESFTKCVPEVFMTFTKDKGIFIWYENLMNETVSFMCMHVFKYTHNDPTLDAEFLEFPPTHPSKYHHIKENKSLLFKQ